MSKVMLVEDDQVMRGLLETLLTMEGHEIVHWESGEDFLWTIKHNQPDVILLDVHIRGRGPDDINGFDLLRRIRQDPELKGTTVLVSSGMDFRDKCKQEGADGFILKPYAPDELIQLIQQNITKKKR